MGLTFMSGVFIYDAVQDGEMAAPEQTALHGCRRKESSDSKKFAAWLTLELLKHPPGPTSEISYWRLRDFVNDFKTALIRHKLGVGVGSKAAEGPRCSYWHPADNDVAHDDALTSLPTRLVTVDAQAQRSTSM